MDARNGVEQLESTAPPPADRQLADLDDQLRRVGERAKAAGQLSRRLRAFERFDQPGQGAAVDAAAVPAATGQSPMSPNLLRQETLEADGEPAFMPLRAPPQRA